MDFKSTGGARLRSIGHFSAWADSLDIPVASLGCVLLNLAETGAWITISYPYLTDGARC